jgi:glutathione S-transferase
MPNGQMPILEVDGKVMFQSTAIARFLAKKVGLVGSDDYENYQIDNVVETMNDFRASKCR